MFVTCFFFVSTDQTWSSVWILKHKVWICCFSSAAEKGCFKKYFWGSSEFKFWLSVRTFGFYLIFSVWTLLEPSIQSEVGFISGSWSSECPCWCSFSSECPRITLRLQFLTRPAGRQQRVAAGSWRGGASAWATSGTRWAAAWWLNLRRWDSHTQTHTSSVLWLYTSRPPSYRDTVLCVV